MAKIDTQILADPKFQEFIIDRCLSIESLYESLDLYVPVSGNVLCAFHDNTDTPAAKIYHSEQGDSLFCFAERRKYRPRDFFRLESFPHSLSDVFSRIWDNLSDEARISLYEQKDVHIDSLSPLWNTRREELDGYRKGTITYESVTGIILDILDS